MTIKLWSSISGTALVMLFAGVVHAQEVSVQEAWIRGTVQGQSATGAFMEITARSAARLVGAASPVAKSAEVHQMKMENGVMRMSSVASVELPAGRTVKFAAGGYHVMLSGLQHPLRAGDRVPLQLLLEYSDRQRGTIELSVEVRDVTGQPAPHHRH